ncbi:MAG: hypothetical protein Q8Q14_12085 [Gemmatimonadales bacterium]|nr:hypothetical protein [Gemmatimonadales bacterium]
MHRFIVRSYVIGITVTLAFAGVARAQDTTSRDTTQRDSTARLDTLPSPLLPPPPPAPPPAPPPPPPPPPPPTPEQVRYMDGLRSTSRGVAQLKDAVDRVVRTQQGADTLRRRRAASRMGGLCGSAQSFISSGRARMQPTAYSDSMRIVARRLVVRIDSLVKVLPACERTAVREASTVATDLAARLRAYDDALTAFRAAAAALNRPDTTKTISQQ